MPTLAWSGATPPTSWKCESQRDVFTALNVTPPKKIIDLTAGR
ncbi:hypothetical protein ACFQLX_21725 [Streptomyces polyrhachis]|uniref:Uncharacterized protein n=1 Tax=Streptomyces polyrhachis TaxID=1282885 RepID=A0ABW2GM69_9ACTN